MANEVAVKKKSGLEISLTDSLNEVQNALPDGFNIPRFVNNSMALIEGNKPLYDFCAKNPTNVLQVKKGLVRGAFLGLDAMNKEFYLIPYGNQLQFMCDYRGDVKLAKKYSIRPIKDIYAKIVRQGDEYSEEIIGTETTIKFKPIPFNDGAVIGAFAVVVYEDGGMEYDSMSLADLEKTKRAASNSNSPAWKNYPAEMYKKTVLHRLCKHIEIDFESPKQREFFDEDTKIDFDEQQKIEVPDVTEVEVVDSENTTV